MIKFNIFNHLKHIKMTNTKQTSKKVASDAGKALSNPKSTKLIKELAASSLGQARNKKK
jgi:hypothetical protein